MTARAFSASLVASACAHAQNVFFTLVPSKPVIDVGESVHVELWATMDAPALAFGAAKIDLNNTKNGLNGTIGGIELNPALAAGGLASVTPNNDLRTFTPFQVHFPPLFPANTANPIMIAEFDWTAQAKGNVTYAVDVLDEGLMPNPVVIIMPLPVPTVWQGIEGDGSWTVIPTPGGVPALDVLAVGVTPRRRERQRSICAA